MPQFWNIDGHIREDFGFKVVTAGSLASWIQGQNIMKPDEFICSSNGKVMFLYGTDGRMYIYYLEYELVMLDPKVTMDQVYNGAPSTDGFTYIYLEFFPNLMYAKAKVWTLWSEGNLPEGKSAGYLKLDNFGYVQLFTSDNVLYWSTPYPNRHWHLWPHRLTIRNDGNLVMYNRNGWPIWASMSDKLTRGVDYTGHCDYLIC